jgi:hypothetical protein
MDPRGRPTDPERRPRRFTVDDLFSLPDWGVRAEVLDGRKRLCAQPWCSGWPSWWPGVLVQCWC